MLKVTAHFPCSLFSDLKISAVLSQDFRTGKRNLNYSVSCLTPVISFIPTLGMLSFTLSAVSQSCVAAFLDVVIDGRAVETPPMSAVNLLEGLSRTVVYMTYSQLTALVMPAAPGKGHCQPAPSCPTLAKAGWLALQLLPNHCLCLGWLHAERDVKRSA